MSNPQEPYADVLSGQTRFNEGIAKLMRMHNIQMNIHFFKTQRRLVEYVEQLERLMVELYAKLGDDERKEIMKLFDVAMKAASEYQEAQAFKVDQGFVIRALNEASRKGVTFELKLQEYMDKTGYGMPNKEEQAFFDDS